MGVELKQRISAAVFCVTVFVAGCSATDSGAAPKTSSTSKAPATVVPAAMSDAIKARLQARTSSLAASGDNPLIQTADEVRAQSNGEEHAVDRGLDAAGTQRLMAKNGNDGISVVFHFPSADAALADLKASTSNMGGSTIAYAAPGVPTSAGADELLDGKAKDRNITFVIGSYEFRLGFSLDNGDTPSRAEFIAMTKAWYDAANRLG